MMPAPLNGTPVQPAEQTLLQVGVDAPNKSLLLLIRRGPLQVVVPIGPNPDSLIATLRAGERQLTGHALTLTDAQGRPT